MTKGLTKGPKMVWCELGNHEVLISGTLEEVRGYEKPRKGGGPNQIVLRQPLGRYACWQHVEMAKRNISEGQGEFDLGEGE